jgi:hypothetical protein
LGDLILRDGPKGPPRDEGVVSRKEALTLRSDPELGEGERLEGRLLVANIRDFGY